MKTWKTKKKSLLSNILLQLLKLRTKLILSFAIQIDYIFLAGFLVATSKVEELAVENGPLPDKKLCFIVSST